MSHSNIINSPAGTPLAERTVGEIVAQNPNLSRVFQAHGIDFCCQGGRTLQEACARKEVDLATMEAQIEAGLAEPVAEHENPAHLPPVELIDHIVSKHHGFLRDELPRLHEMSARVARVHGEHTPTLVEVFEVFSKMSEELANHMMKEEQILFPAIRAMVSGGGLPVRLDGPVACMLQEHDDAGAALARMRELTNGFTPPMDACNTYRALFAGLTELESDLHCHIHLENSVLFPQAMAMAAA